MVYVVLTDDSAIDSAWCHTLADGNTNTYTTKTFLVVWADGDEEQGEYHLPFKLSGSGEEIGLYTSPDSGTTEVHTIVFGQQVADVSHGMFPDGNGYW